MNNFQGHILSLVLTQQENICGSTDALIVPQNRRPTKHKYMSMVSHNSEVRMQSYISG